MVSWLICSRRPCVFDALGAVIPICAYFTDSGEKFHLRSRSIDWYAQFVESLFEGYPLSTYGPISQRVQDESLGTRQRVRFVVLCHNPQMYGCCHDEG